MTMSPPLWVCERDTHTSFKIQYATFCPQGFEEFLCQAAFICSRFMGPDPKWKGRIKSCSLAVSTAEIWFPLLKPFPWASIIQNWNSSHWGKPGGYEGVYRTGSTEPSRHVHSCPAFKQLFPLEENPLQVSIFFFTFSDCFASLTLACWITTSL